MSAKLAGLLGANMGAASPGLMGLLGNPMMQVGMGLLASRADPRINPFGAAMTGLTNAAQFRQIEEDRKREMEERERMDKVREQLSKIIPSMFSTRVEGPPTPDGVAPTQISPMGQAIGEVAQLDPLGAFDMLTRMNGPAGANNTAAIRNIMERERRVSMYGPDSPEVQQFDAYVRSNTVYNGVPISGVTGTPVGGQPSVSFAADVARQVAQGSQAGQEQSKLDFGNVNDAIAQTWAARDAYAIAESMYNTSRQVREKIENGVLDTGPIDAFLYQLLGVGSQELAAMNADQVKATLENLQITNLAPVTVQELRTVAGLWADIAKQETPNIGVLRRAEEKSQRLMERIRGDAAINAGRVRDYGSPAEYDRLINANPFVRMAIDSQSTQGKPNPADFSTFEDYKAAVEKWQRGGGR